MLAVVVDLKPFFADRQQAGAPGVSFKIGRDIGGVNESVSGGPPWGSASGRLSRQILGGLPFVLADGAATRHHTLVVGDHDLRAETRCSALR